MHWERNLIESDSVSLSGQLHEVAACSPKRWSSLFSPLSLSLFILLFSRPLTLAVRSSNAVLCLAARRGMSEQLDRRPLLLCPSVRTTQVSRPCKNGESYRVADLPQKTNVNISNLHTDAQPRTSFFQNIIHHIHPSSYPLTPWSHRGLMEPIFSSHSQGIRPGPTLFILTQGAI